MTDATIPRLDSLTPLALGCEILGGADWGSVDFDEARRAVRCALDHGISVFDTADVYGLGRGEEELSRVLGADRHRVTIVTKGGVRWTAQGTGRATTRRDMSDAYLSAAIDASLKRLRIETIPVYLVHWPDETTPLEQTLGSLERMRQAGKIRHYGLSNFGRRGIREGRAFPSSSVVEESLSLISHDDAVHELVEVRHDGLATLTYGPLAQGLFTAKYRADSAFDQADRRHRLDHFTPVAFQRYTPILDALQDIARDVERSPAQVAIRWVLETGAATAVIFGAKSSAQVVDNCSALSWTLDVEHQRSLQAARTGVNLTSDHATAGIAGYTHHHRVK